MFEEFIARMEESYPSSSKFQESIRCSVEKIKLMDVSPVTKIALLKNVEQTYALHSKNYSSLGNIRQSITDKTDSLRVMLENKRDELQAEVDHAIKSGHITPSFDIDLD